MFQMPYSPRVCLHEPLLCLLVPKISTLSSKKCIENLYSENLYLVSKETKCSSMLPALSSSIRFFHLPATHGSNISSKYLHNNYGLTMYMIVFNNSNTVIETTTRATNKNAMYRGGIKSYTFFTLVTNL